MATQQSPDPVLRGDAKPRLMSLDALRGFDMCMIVGGGTLLNATAQSIDPQMGQWMAAQTEHPEWNGYTPWDQIFPMFMFIAGVAMPLSMTRRLEQGHARSAMYMQVIRRGLMLVLLGLIYQGLLKFEFETLRYPTPAS